MGLPVWQREAVNPCEPGLQGLEIGCGGRIETYDLQVLRRKGRWHHRGGRRASPETTTPSRQASRTGTSPGPPGSAPSQTREVSEGACRCCLRLPAGSESPALPLAQRSGSFVERVVGECYLKNSGATRRGTRNSITRTGARRRFATTHAEAPADDPDRCGRVLRFRRVRPTAGRFAPSRFAQWMPPPAHPRTRGFSRDGLST